MATTSTGRSLSRSRSPAPTPPPPTTSPSAGPGPGTGWVERVQQPTLTLSYWFEAEPQRGGAPVVVRFQGHRCGTGARGTARDQFIREERIDSLGPASGRVSITARIQGINPGDWEVSAAAVDPACGLPRRARRVTPAGLAVRRAAWSWRRWSLAEALSEPVHTRENPLVSIPGIVLGIWPAMVAVGIAVALGSFALLYGPAGGRGPAAPVVLGALLAGAIGAKAWFVLPRRRRHPEEGLSIGWCIQGFVTGVLVGVAIPALLGAIPAGIFLDAAAPGILLGIGAGRIGCFLAGCCVGRPTQSRWGIWSSDRRVGIRRVPTQLMEAALAGGLGVAALTFVLRVGTAHGGVFAASLAAYTLLRQGILGLRAEPRLSTIGPRLTAAATAAVIVADLVIHATGLLHLPAGV